VVCVEDGEEGIKTNIQSREAKRSFNFELWSQKEKKGNNPNYVPLNIKEENFKANSCSSSGG